MMNLLDVLAPRIKAILDLKIANNQTAHNNFRYKRTHEKGLNSLVTFNQLNPGEE